MRCLASWAAALPIVPIIAAAVTHLTLTRTLPNPDPAT
jgi:hypothetical protein